MFYTFLSFGVIGSVVLLATDAYKRVLKFAFDLYETPPGMSKLHHFKKNYFVHTNIGDFRLNYHRNPSLDLDVYFFNNGHKFDNVTGNKLMKKIDFEKEFEAEDTTKLSQYNFGLVADIYYPQQFKKKDKIVGFMINIFDDVVFVFTVKNDNIIDYRELFRQYEKAMEQDIYDGGEQLDLDGVD